MHTYRPRTGDKNRAMECMELNLMDNVTFTSNAIGIIDGNGEKWWGIPGIGYLRRGNDRPKLFRTEDSKNLLVENLLLKDSPRWTFEARNVDGLEVRNVEIDARRTDQERALLNIQNTLML